MVQSPLVSAQSTPSGRLSIRSTSIAAPGPVLVTVIVKLATSPALIVSSAAVLRTTTAGQLTVIVAVSETGSSLEASAVAVLVSVPQSAASVAPETITLALASSARSPKAQLSTWPVVPASGVMVQRSLLSLQSIPLGRLSVRVTPKAVPGPLLVTVIVK